MLEAEGDRQKTAIARREHARVFILYYSNLIEQKVMQSRPWWKESV